MDKKGFTLIEVIGVVIILASIVLIITPNINNSLKNSKNKAFDVQIEEIKSATKSWVALNSENTPKEDNEEVIINLLQLKLSGLIAYDFKNPKTGELFPDDMMIKIIKKGLAYTYVVLTDTGTSNNSGIDPFGPQIVLNGGVYLYLEVGEFGSIPGATYKDKLGNNVSVSDITYEKDGVAVSGIDYNNLGKYVVTYSVTLDGKTNSIKRYVEIVDTKAPTILVDGYSDNVCVDIEISSSFTLPTMKVTDNYTSSLLIDKKVIGNISNIPGIKRITYRATDSSGNSSEFILCINMRDTIKPVITNVENVYNASLKKNVITVSASDTGTGLNRLAYSFDDGKTWQENNYFISDESLIVRVRDKVGLISDGVEVIINNEIAIIDKPQGSVVYFDVTTGSVCDNYHEDNSLTGYNGTSSTKTTDNQNGCLKFYAFNYTEGDTKANLILDHNTTGVTFGGSSSSNANGPEKALPQLRTDTDSWVGTETPDNYTVSQTTGGNYTIPYKDEGYKARLITANEVARITGNTAFDESNVSDSFFFDTNEIAVNQSPTCKKGNISGCGYGWLYDRSSTYCAARGCFNNASSGATEIGYWTATSVSGSSISLWGIDSLGGIGTFAYGKEIGVRPVIEVLSSKLVRKAKAFVITKSQGSVVYFDVTTGNVCNNYHEDNSITGYNGTSSTKTTNNQNGCLRFYAFNYTNGDARASLILDHNTTGVTYWTNSSISNNTNGPVIVLEQLKTDTNSWVGTEILSNYTVSQSGYGNYTIPYKDEGYKARLITANEVAKITGNTSFNESTTSKDNWFLFDTNSNQVTSSTHSYGWLYDRTHVSCEENGCLSNADSSMTGYGYWTSTSIFGSSDAIWRIGNGGGLHYGPGNDGVTVGVRPVIEVLASKLISNVKVSLIDKAQGGIIYFDVTTGNVCNNYHSDNSLTGYNGTSSTKTTNNQNSCLKFYAFNYTKDTVRTNLILDHNTTGVTYWTNTGVTSNANGPVTVLAQLKTDTNSWVGTETPNNYTVSQTGYGNYTIPYKNEGYKARLITADEVAKITGNTSFSESTTSYSNWFYFDTNTQTNNSSWDALRNYGWLYDRASTACADYGCLNNADSEMTGYGFWTGTSAFGNASYAWVVNCDDIVYGLNVDLGDGRGVRPVIEVLSSKLVK